METDSMPSYTRKAVIHDATPDANEVLVVFEDERGIARNVLLRDAAALRTELEAERTTEQPVEAKADPSQNAETPVDAPVFSTVEDAAFAAAEIIIAPVVVEAMAVDTVAAVAEPPVEPPVESPAQ